MASGATGSPEARRPSRFYIAYGIFVAFAAAYGASHIALLLSSSPELATAVAVAIFIGTVFMLDAPYERD